MYINFHFSFSLGDMFALIYTFFPFSFARTRGLSFILYFLSSEALFSLFCELNVEHLISFFQLFDILDSILQHLLFLLF